MMWIPEKHRPLVSYITAATVLTAVIVAHDWQAQQEDVAFYAEMREFMNEGGRNTAEEGYELCLRIAHLEKEHHRDQHERTCAEIYFPKGIKGGQ